MRKNRTSKKNHANKSSTMRGRNRDTSKSSRAHNPSDIKQSQRLTSRTQNSSLDPRTKLEIEAPRGRAARTTGADDLQSVTDNEDSTLQSAAELVDEEQDLQAEELEAIEKSRNRAGAPPRTRDLPAPKVPSYKDRNRL